MSRPENTLSVAHENGSTESQQQSNSYAVSRSAKHRPTLSLQDMQPKHRSRMLQLSWVGLVRPR